MSDFFPRYRVVDSVLAAVGSGAVAVLWGPARVRTDSSSIPVVTGIALAFLVSLGLLFSAVPGKTTNVA